MTPFTYVELAALTNSTVSDTTVTIFYPAHVPCSHTDGDKLGPLQPQPVRWVPRLTSGQDVNLATSSCTLRWDHSQHGSLVSVSWVPEDSRKLCSEYHLAHRKPEETRQGCV